MSDILKKYYAFTPSNDLVFVGKFKSFGEAFDYADYEIDLNFVWIISETRLKLLQNKITEILVNSDEKSLNM